MEEAFLGVNKLKAENMLLDINGDGLPDLVSRDSGGNLRVRYNTGSEFSEEVIRLEGETCQLGFVFELGNLS